MTNKPKYLLIKPDTKYKSEFEYHDIIYTDYININKIYELIKKYDIKYTAKPAVPSSFDSKTCDKLNNLGSNTFILGGVICTRTEDDSACPTLSLSQTGNCVILRSSIVDYPAKIRDNAIIGESSHCFGNIIIKDNAIVLRTSIAHWTDDDDFHEYNNNVIIQDNSVILNSSIEIEDDDLFTIDIRDHAYLKDVKINKNGNHYNKSSSVILSSYTYLEKMELCFSAYIEGLVRIYNINIKSNDKLTFHIYKPCTLVGVTIDINKITEEELVSFFKKNKIKKNIRRNDNIVGYCNRMYVLLDDFINEFSN